MTYLETKITPWILYFRRNAIHIYTLLKSVELCLIKIFAFSAEEWFCFAQTDVNLSLIDAQLIMVVVTRCTDKPHSTQKDYIK